MKLSTSVFFTFAVVLAVSRSSHASSVNGLRPKSGGQEGGESGAPSPERLQALIDETCPTFDCTTVNTDTLDCTMEEPPARPDLSSMTDVEKDALKADIMAKKEEKKEQVMNCACCADISVEELLGGEGNTTRLSSTEVDGLSFLLESSNSDGIVATEEVSASPANRRVMSYSIGVAVASVYAVV